MITNFQVKQVNSPFDDTSFFIRNMYKKSPFLFDCGRLGKITNSEILSISDIFISHTHIDHFYGFDRIIRGSICADKTIRVFGPPGIIKNVQGKIDAYTWNLIKSYNLNISVIELSKKDIFRQATYSAFKGFIPELTEIRYDDIELGDGFTFEYEFFDHGINSMGYRINEPQQIHINKELLNDKGYVPGKWIGELNNALEMNAPKDTIIECEMKEGIIKKSIKELEEEIIIYKKPQSITFMTDLAPTYTNIQKAINFAKDSTILLIEGMFLKNEILHSIDKKHLTLELSKYIFQQSTSKYVKFFHFAPRYEYNKDAFFGELYKDMRDFILPQ